MIKTARIRELERRGAVEEARNLKAELVETHFGLLYYVVCRYWETNARFQGRFELDEGIAMGCEAFYRAISTWDPKKGTLATYVRIVVDRHLTRMLHREGYVVRIPEYRREYPLVNSLDVPVSMDDGDESQPSRGDQLKAQSLNPEEQYLEMEMHQNLGALWRWILRHLREPHRSVLTWRLIQGWTFREIGTRLTPTLSGERARQIMREAVDTIRRQTNYDVDTIS